MSTRREFIAKGSLASLIGVSTGLIANQTAFGFEQMNWLTSKGKVNSLQMFTESYMKTFINTVFDVKHKSSREFASLKLIEVSKISQSKNFQSKVKSNNFTMLFERIKGTHLPQENYDFRHTGIGSFSAFLVPITGNQDYYEMHINNLT